MTNSSRVFNTNRFDKSEGRESNQQPILLQDIEIKTGEELHENIVKIYFKIAEILENDELQDSEPIQSTKIIDQDSQLVLTKIEN